jgi:hypothetical protein
VRAAAGPGAASFVCLFVACVARWKVSRTPKTSNNA